jgi:hypothetical protein
LHLQVMELKCSKSPSNTSFILQMNIFAKLKISFLRPQWTSARL